METPPPYNRPSSKEQSDNSVKMTKPKLITLLIVCMLAGAFAGFGVAVNILMRPLRELYADQAQRLRAVEFREIERDLESSRPDLPYESDESLNHYDGDREISFIMNSHTRFVPVPADMAWVRTIDFSGTMVSPAPDGAFTVENDQYMWEIDPKELKKLCGDGSRAIPVKVTICNKKTGKDKIMHLTDFLMQFRPNGSADISAHGYIFDK